MPRETEERGVVAVSQSSAESAVKSRACASMTIEVVVGASGGSRVECSLSGTHKKRIVGDHTADMTLRNLPHNGGSLESGRGREGYLMALEGFT